MSKLILGFGLSILLTLAAFGLVSKNVIVGSPLTFVILALAIIQAAIQLVLFLDIDKEKNPRWNLMAFISTVALILIIVVGSLWIMNNLSYHTPSDQELIEQEGIYK